MSRMGNYGSGGAGRGNSLTEMNNEPSWSFAAIGPVESTHEVGSDAGSTTVQGPEDDEDNTYESDNAPSYEEGGWNSGDAEWPSNASTPQFDTNDVTHVEDADDGRVEEIRLGASSSEQTDTANGLF